MSRSRHGEAGFTLIEVIAALGVATALVLGLAATLALAMKARASLRERSTANEAARARMEEILAPCRSPGGVSRATRRWRSRPS